MSLNGAAGTWATAMRAVALVWLAAAATTHAAFLNTFGNVTQGAPLHLRWDPVDPKYYPLTVTARMINRTEGSKANGIVVNLTNKIMTGSHWAWETVPSPLPYIHGALYELQVRPSGSNPSAAADGVSVLSRSSYFTLRDDNSSQQKPGQLVTGNDHDTGSGGPNRTVALGVGVSIGIASAIALVIVAVMLRRRRKRVLAEKRRRGRFDLNIH